ncbi:hypothetical protein Patl1_29899 [Pistacia atlantica]|uniref:Uncharacterized protein n=1 Tax=Pistacia atlantica TaxID=434234 RepID=A0ACC1ABB5_9ROSI|nr:hypothetical protein Patl1_29899 [Pistacia atlantica]
MLAAVLFLVPFIRRFLERFNFRFIMLMMWWSQPRLYVGRGMLETFDVLFSLFNVQGFCYSYEVVVSYYIEVYFTDAQIWYAIFSAFVGGLYGAFCHLGEILSNKEKEAARFAQLWNKIISSFREEDLISNRYVAEMDLLLVPYWADRDLDLIQWPPFLLANMISIALDMAKDSNGKDRELKNGIETDPYMSLAIKECYASLKNIIMFLVRGDHEKEVIEYIFGEVEKYIEEGTLIKEYKMSALPSLYEHFVKLIKYLLDNKQEDKDQVVITF